MTDERGIDQEGRVAIRANADDAVGIDGKAAAAGRAVANRHSHIAVVAIQPRLAAFGERQEYAAERRSLS